MKGARWIAFVVVLLLGNVAAVGALIAASSGDADRRVLPDYYRRAAAWNQTMSAEKQSLDLGWSARVALRPDGLTVGVTDGRGEPVHGGAVRITARPRARADATVVWTALEAEPGQYRTSVPLSSRGLWDLDIQVHRADVAWTTRRVVDTEAR